MKSEGHLARKKKKSIIVETIQYQGICPSCENFPLCNLIHIPKLPVTFCEEFLNNGASNAAKAAKKQKRVTKGRVHLKRYNDLCSSCENSDNCIFPKDEAGVWRCEEYR